MNMNRFLHLQFMEGLVLDEFPFLLGMIFQVNMLWIFGVYR